MLLCIGLLFEPLLIPVLWVMLVLTAITAIQRFVKVAASPSRAVPRHASSCGGRAARAGVCPHGAAPHPRCRDAAPDSGGSAGPSRPGSIAAAGRCRDLRRLPNARRGSPAPAQLRRDGSLCPLVSAPTSPARSGGR